jgi:hypothetical protein
MKFNIGDHLQEIDSYHNHQNVNGYVIESFTSTKSGANWYLLENDELNLTNHWTPESKLELHKQPLRDLKLEQLGIKYN